MAKLKNQRIYEIIAFLILVFSFYFRMFIQRTSSFIWIADLFLLLLLFTSFTDTQKNHFKYKLIFWIFTVISILNEGILKNAGGHNWTNFGLDLLVKASVGILVYVYLNKKSKLIK